MVADVRALIASAKREARTLTMGILNVTPDSFSDGGRYFSAGSAREQIDRMLAEGADIIDIGGESTRPGATPVDASTQLSRVLDAVRYAARDRNAVVSIDTTLPEVAESALDEGASIVNDVSCLADPRLADVTAKRNASLIIMHSRGSMAQMEGFSNYPRAGYEDVVADVTRDLEDARNRALEAGMKREDVLLDPGLGFHKNADHSYELLARLGEMRSLDAPLVVGASRKSFLTRDVEASVDARVGGSIAAAIWAAREGASILRVHDVLATRQALAIDRAIEKSRRPPC